MRASDYASRVVRSPAAKQVLQGTIPHNTRLAEQELQRGPDDLIGLRGGHTGVNGTGGFLGVGLLPAEGDEREDCVVHFRLLGRRGVGGTGGFPCSGDAHFILQLHQDALGGFLTDAFCFGKSSGVSSDDAGFEVRHARRAEHVERGLWPDAADVGDEEAEEVAFTLRGEAVEDVRVFADGEVREYLALRTDGRQLVVTRNRNKHMIADTADIQNDLRGQRFYERAGKVINHAAWRSRLGALRLLLALFCSQLCAGESKAWMLVAQPKFLAHKVTQPISAAKETVFAAARWTDIGPDFATASEWSEAGMDVQKATASTRALAAAWLREVKPQLVRNDRKIIEFALLKSDKIPIAATVLAPEFLKEFEDVFGPKMIVVMPNLYTVFVFPGIAGTQNAYSDLILGAWHSKLPKVSREVFELTASGIRAVGIFEE